MITANSTSVKEVAKSLDRADVSFPIIGKSHNNNKVVLFFRKKEGLVLDPGSSRSAKGHVSVGFMMSYYTEYNDAYTIQNS